MLAEPMHFVLQHVPVFINNCMLVQIALFVDGLSFTDCEPIGLSKGWKCRFNAKTKAFLLPTWAPNVLLYHYAVASGGKRVNEIYRDGSP
jgi:hypothetical protein